MLIMLMIIMLANTMAASKNFFEFYGAWFGIRPANQKLVLFLPRIVPPLQQALIMGVNVF